MNPTQWFVVASVLGVLALVATDRLRIDVGAVSLAAILALAQFLGLGVLAGPDTPGAAIQALSGFGQPVVITLFSLFVLTRALDKTGVTRWIAGRVQAVGGGSERRLIVLFAGVTALLSLFMNNLAAGALLLPSAMDIARRTGIRPSKLLIPVAYGSLLGGVATYFTTANIIVSDLLTTANPPQAPLHILDFTPTGGLILVGGLIFFALFGQRLLPDRPPRPEQAAARQTGSQLEAVYHLDERRWRLRVPAGAGPVGQSLAAVGIGERFGVAVAALWRRHEALVIPGPEEVFQVGDELLVIGQEERVRPLAEAGFDVRPDEGSGSLSARGARFVEVVVAPHGQVEGTTLKNLDFRKQYGFTALALLREGQSYRTDVAAMPLKAGDSLLMVGDPARLKFLHASPDFIVLEPSLSDQPLETRRALLSAGIILAAIVASILGAPVFLAMLVGALAAVLVGLLTMEEIYRAMEWQAILLIAGMYSVSLAMVNTGLAALIGEAVVGVVAPLGALGLAAGVYLLTAALTQVMGGQVTALVTGPIAISAAISLGVSPQAMAVAAAIGCSASFFTPIAHPVNILMIGPGNYKFSDFFRIGWGLTVVAFVLLLIGMRLFWGL